MKAPLLTIANGNLVLHWLIENYVEWRRFLLSGSLITKGWVKAEMLFGCRRQRTLKSEWMFYGIIYWPGSLLGITLTHDRSWASPAKRTLVTSIRSHWIYWIYRRFYEPTHPHSLIGYKFDNVRLPRCLTTSYTSRTRGKKWHRTFYDSSSSSPPIINKVMKAAKRKNFSPTFCRSPRIVLR